MPKKTKPITIWSGESWNGNKAEIEKDYIYPYIGAPKRIEGYRLLVRDAEGSLFFVSVFEDEKSAREWLLQMAWKAEEIS